MKNHSVLLNILFLILTFHTLCAQYPTDTKYQSIPTPFLPLPAYLQTTTDRSTPSPIDITRVTTYFAPWEWYPTYEYPKIQIWNANQSLYRIRSWKIYDAVTHKVVRELPGGIIYPSYWSNTDSDLIYSFQEDGTIKKYSVSSESIQIVDKIQGYEFIKLGPGEGNIDNFDHYVALVGKKGTDLDILIYDLRNLKLVFTKTLQGAWSTGNRLGEGVPKYIDWVSVSQSGNYVGIMWDHNVTSKSNPFNGHYGMEIYNRSDMKFLRRIAEYGNHGDFGFAVDGREVFVQFWGPTGSVNMYYLDNGKRTVLSAHADLDAAGHISCRNIQRPGWAYLTISSSRQSGQIIAIKLDESGIVEHFGHHFSSNTSYDKSPMGLPSPFGTKVMFKSDFGDDANKDLAYCFEATSSDKLKNNDKLMNEQLLTIYPSPANHEINIKSNHLLNRIALYNHFGHEVYSSTGHNTKEVIIDVSTLPKGWYILRVLSTTGVHSHKIPVE